MALNALKTICHEDRRIIIDHSVISGTAIVKIGRPSHYYFQTLIIVKLEGDVALSFENEKIVDDDFLQSANLLYSLTVSAVERSFS